MKNQYPGRCSRCNLFVAANAGYYDRASGVLCAEHAPVAAPQGEAVVVMDIRGDRQAFVKAEGYLGDKFPAFKQATTDAGCKFEPSTKGNLCSLEAASRLIQELQRRGLKVDVRPKLVQALTGRVEQVTTELKAAGQRLETVDAVLAKKGLSLFFYQRDGVQWLSPRVGALLADGQGCVDGQATLRVNRAGKGFECSIEDAHKRFHGISGHRNWDWDPSIPTFVRALCNGELRQHRVLDILKQGCKPVVLVTADDGRKIRVTPDHEFARPDGSYTSAESLCAGDEISINGQAACTDCGSTSSVITYPYAKFVGKCRQCVYRKHRSNPGLKGETRIDKDGYVWERGHWDHPQNTRGYVMLHILVMEKRLGRHLEPGELVHHKNENRADNADENLLLSTNTDHWKHHQWYRNLNGGVGGKGGDVLFVPKTAKIVSVVSDGEAEVYDLVMEDPHRNFVANGFIVHNCGKTIETITALPDNAPVVVICPAVVKGVWQNEIAKWRSDFRTTQLSGRGSFRWPEPGEVTIINYDILPKAPNPKTQTKGDDVAQPPPGCVIVADEAHFVKSGKAQRSQALRRLSAMVQAKSGRTWLLTGTPLVNRPPELWSVLQCANIATEAFSSFNNFKRMFNATETGYQGALEWGHPEPEVPELLKRVMLRRIKSEVLKDLPEKMYQTVPVDIDAKYAREIEKVLKAKGETIDQVVNAIETAMANTGKIPFEKYSAVREVLARSKYGALLEWLEPYEEAGEPVLVFSAHLWPVQTLVEQKLAEGKRWGLITGSDTNAAQRTQIVEDFQSGKLDGVAMTIKAGGVGITLTRAKTACFLDSSWSPADNEQAEDRIHRIGQTRGTTIVSMVATHPLDERVHELLSIKAELIAATTEAARTSPGQEVRTSTGDIEAALATIQGALGVRVIEGAPPGAVPASVQPSRPVVGSPAVPREPPPPQRKVYRPAQNATEEWAVRGLETLIMLDPDRARIQNQEGFNAADGEFGRILYNTYSQAGGLTERQWEVTVKMLRKYHGQIGRAPDYVKPEAKPKKPRATKAKIKPDEGENPATGKKSSTTRARKR
jgi:SWI/SNF-related matrix-associated actin-dependent regulator 1 of chromatin subfamily A